MMGSEQREEVRHCSPLLLLMQSLLRKHRLAWDSWFLSSHLVFFLKGKLAALGCMQEEGVNHSGPQQQLSGQSTTSLLCGTVWDALFLWTSSNTGPSLPQLDVVLESYPHLARGRQVCCH